MDTWSRQHDRRRGVPSILTILCNMSHTRARCFICNHVVPSRSRWSPPTETLEEIFATFCKYIVIEREKFQLDFSVDLFPFCRTCRKLLIQLHEQHNAVIRQVFQIMEKMQGIVAAKVISSEDAFNSMKRAKRASRARKRSNRFGSESDWDDDDDEYDDGEDEVADKRASVFRQLVLERYSPSVRIGKKEQELCKRKFDGASTLPLKKRRILSTTSNSSDDESDSTSESSSGLTSYSESSYEEDESSEAEDATTETEPVLRPPTPDIKLSQFIDYQYWGLQAPIGLMGAQNPYHSSESYMPAGSEAPATTYDCNSEVTSSKEYEFEPISPYGEATKSIDSVRPKQVKTYDFRGEKAKWTDEHNYYSKCYDLDQYETIDAEELKLLRNSVYGDSSKKLLYHGNHGTHPFEQIGPSGYKCGTCDYSSNIRKSMMEHIQSTHDQPLEEETSKIVQICDGVYQYEQWKFTKSHGDVLSCCSCMFSTKDQGRMKDHLLEDHLCRQ